MFEFWSTERMNYSSKEVANSWFIVPDAIFGCLRLWGTTTDDEVAKQLLIFPTGFALFKQDNKFRNDNVIWSTLLPVVLTDDSWNQRKHKLSADEIHSKCHRSRNRFWSALAKRSPNNVVSWALTDDRLERAESFDKLTLWLQAMTHNPHATVYRLRNWINSAVWAS
jgi:hypothetical protein